MPRCIQRSYWRPALSRSIGSKFCQNFSKRPNLPRFQSSSVRAINNLFLSSSSTLVFPNQYNPLLTLRKSIRESVLLYSTASWTSISSEESTTSYGRAGAELALFFPGGERPPDVSPALFERVGVGEEVMAFAREEA